MKLTLKNTLAVTSLAMAAFTIAGCNGGSNGGGGLGGGGNGGATFTQQDRLARPLVNEVLATFANNRHRVNNLNSPPQDPGDLAQDIEAFLSHPQHPRSPQIRNVIRAVLVPDMMIADLSQGVTTASYLGSETGGATGSRFGGRALQDDVVDISLGIIFGDTIPKLGLAPDDGLEIPTLTSDNVGPSNNRIAAFPYLAPPR